MIFGEPDEPTQRPPSSAATSVVLDTSRMDTVYANVFALAGSEEEMVLYLGVNSPLPNVAQPPIKVSHRLVLLPTNAKRLMFALQQALRAHEDRFGPIELPPPRRPENAS